MLSPPQDTACREKVRHNGCSFYIPWATFTIKHSAPHTNTYKYILIYFHKAIQIEDAELSCLAGLGMAAHSLPQSTATLSQLGEPTA
jgi:hypothetical protein